MRTSSLFCSLIAILPTFVACGGPSGTTPSPDGTATATVQGRLESSAGVTAESISAYQLAGNGELVAVSDGAVSIDGSGEYSIDITVPEPEAGPIIVQAESGSDVQGSVVVSHGSAVDGIIIAAPIGLESTVESDVHMSATVSLSLSLDAGDSAALAMLVDDHMGEIMAASEDYEADVDAVAQSVIAAAAGFEAALEAQQPDAAGALATAEAALADAQAQLSADLHGATSEEQAQAAIVAFQEAFADAYLDAGFTTDELAAAAHAATESAVSLSADASADVQQAALAQAHGMLATIVDASVQHQAAAAELGADAEATLAAAGDDLMAEIATAVMAGSDAQATIDQAWATYGATVQPTLEGGLGAAAAALEAVALTMQQAEGELDAAIADANGSATAMGTAIGEAQADFTANATSSTQLELLTEAGQDTAAAEAVLDLMVEVTLAI